MSKGTFRFNNQRKNFRQLFSYARPCAPKGVTFTDGMLTGALKTLVSDEAEYKCISRGVYQKVSANENESQPNITNVVSEYKRILENALFDMENKIQVNPFDVLDMSDDDRMELMKIRQLIEAMRDIL